jgi:Ferritin-like domain
VRRTAPLRTPSNLSSNSVKLISAALTEILADMFALYLKTKNFHWHVSGPHFRDDHRMLDEQGAQILATTDAIAEGVRKVGGTMIRPTDRQPEPQTARFRGAAIRAVFDKSSTLCLCNLNRRHVSRNGANVVLAAVATVI